MPKKRSNDRPPEHRLVRVSQLTLKQKTPNLSIHFKILDFLNTLINMTESKKICNHKLNMNMTNNEDGVDGVIKKRKQERNVKRDPLVVVGTDIMLMILSCLDARSVALSLLVSRAWRALASSDQLWTSKCEELWHDKAHLPRVSKVNGLSKLAAYSLSVMDGKRMRVTKEDLCDHVWEFHYTEAAPEYWRTLDPHWNGTGPPLRRYFHPDGSQTAEADDRIWGGHESCYSIVTSVLADGKIRQHYVRINRWPPMYVTRKRDWSWEISNQLCTYRSIPDADKEEGTGPLFLLY